jgi:hypothetical protein
VKGPLFYDRIIITAAHCLASLPPCQACPISPTGTIPHCLHPLERNPSSGQNAYLSEELVAVTEHKSELEAWARRNTRIEKSWSDGIKYVTGETRLTRARTKFFDLLKRKGIVGLWDQVYEPNLHSFIRVLRGVQEHLGPKICLLATSSGKSANRKK